MTNVTPQSVPVSKPKQRLIDATLESLMEEGIEGCSVRKIADRAGVATGLINYHYPSVHALVADAYSHLAFSFLESAKSKSEATPGDAREQISAFLGEIFSEQVMQRKVLRAWVVFWGLIDSAEAMQAAHRNSTAAFTHHLRCLFERLLPSESALSANMAANGLSAMIDGLWLEWCLQTEAFDCADCIAMCEHWVDSLSQ